jgi:uncharacterized protein
MNCDRINAILYNHKFISYLNKNKKCEKDRIFCHHDLSHFLDVARIAYILNLENNLNYSKDTIYAAALLHDIGRWKQYEEGIPHDAASAELAVDILEECGYSKQEINEIVEAISQHRKVNEDKSSLSYIIYFSDKASRNCFNCKAAKECNWSSEKKNNIIKY